MEKLEGGSEIKLLEMANEDYYRKQASFYRNSKAYGRMTRLYPVLQTLIIDCQGETLVD